MPIVRANGIDICYEVTGDPVDRPLLLIHGHGAQLIAWHDELVAQLGALGFYVITFDNRDAGLSTHFDDAAAPDVFALASGDLSTLSYSIEDMADDAAMLLRALGCGAAHVLGVSMGGMIAQEYALSYPQDLRSVTFACTYAAPGPFCSRMFAMWADLAPVLGVPFVMRDVTLWAFTVPFFEERGEDLAEFETAMRYLDQPVHAYLAQLAVIQQHDTSSRLGEVAVPALVLAGEQDILIPVSLSRRIHEAIPGSEWATTKGGHACVWEHPAEFNQTFLDFVRRHGKG
jgi:3-oxoadipate enol-lactonase